MTRRCLQQHLPRAGPGLAHRREVQANAETAAGELIFQSRVPGRLLDVNGRPVNVQFLGNDHRQGGFDSLTHLRILREQRDPAVRSNPDKGLQRDGAGVAFLLPAGAHAEHQPDSAHCAQLYKFAAVEVGH